MSVIGMKTGMNALSTATPSTNLKAEGGAQNAARDFEKAFGDQSIGDVLNKISDPNWVDPSKKPNAVGKSELDKDAFLKLMLAQMKHQDPTNPLQSHEMAAQLASFTSLEQLSNINKTLEDMSKAQSPNSNHQALGLIGKKVSGDASKLSRVVGDTKHEVNFELLGDAQKVKLTINDDLGNTIRKIDLGEMKKGKNSIDWNGMTDDGMPARPGEYRISVDAQSSTGSKVFAKTAFEGRIKGLTYTPEGPVLLVGNQTVKLSEVRKIEELGPEDLMVGKPIGAADSGNRAVNKLVEQTKAAGTSQVQKQEDEQAVQPAQEIDPSEQSNISDLQMDPELMKKIASKK
jgi:flagellar basal-body rod modification protein FlgD